MVSLAKWPRWVRALPIVLAATSPHAEALRPVTVTDMINMTEIGTTLDVELGTDPVVFSPDRRHFVVITHHGDIPENGNTYSLLLFASDEVRRSPQPRILATLTSRSNGLGISGPRWLDDTTVAFHASSGDDPTGVRAVDIKTGEIAALIAAPTNVMAYDLKPDRRTSVYTVGADAAASLFTEQTDRDGFVISNQLVANLLVGHPFVDDFSGDYSPVKLYAKESGTEPRLLTTPGFRPVPFPPFKLSPDGQWLIAWAWLDRERVPQAWMRYHSAVAPDTFPAAFLLINLATGKVRPLFDAPLAWPRNSTPEIVWTSNNSVVVFDTWLPVEALSPGQDPEARYTLEFNLTGHVTARVSTGSYEFMHWDPIADVLETRKVPVNFTFHDVKFALNPQRSEFLRRQSGSSWRALASPRQSHPTLRVLTDQGYNQSPTLVAQRGQGPKFTLLDPNPQFKTLNFGLVQEITFKDRNGASSTGGLYFPPDYQPGTKLPLVIQTHGWTIGQFSIDGLSTAGYAAQALAGHGFLVAQLPDHDNEEKHDNWEGGPEEGARYASMYEGLIDELDRRALIDRDKVGLLAWSRTGFGVRYALAFSKQKYAAASIVDALDTSYVAYLSYATANATNRSFLEAINAGAPFGPGLQSWLEHSPGFNLDKVTAPIRLVNCLSPGILENWEWYAGLKLLGKPVEFMWLRKAVHAPVRPSDRYAAQEGNVDWFDFWINGHEDPDPKKAEQYTRWRALRQPTPSSAVGLHP